VREEPAAGEDIHRSHARYADPDPVLPTEPDKLSTAQPSVSSDTEGDDPTPKDLAAGALRSARSIAAGRGGGRPARLSRRRRPGGGYSGARPDDRDPALIGSILGNSMAALGWVAPLAQARLMGQWGSVVGSEIAARCQPVSLVDGELKVSAESTAWATQLRLMAPQILARIARELPAGLVTKLIITGPSAPSWKHGPWSMHGGRGARDTYG
jgi:predicted nucleic acid-binding Zn ribbon protein